MTPITQQWPRTAPYFWALWIVFILERFYEVNYLDFPGAENGVKVSYIATGIVYDLFLALVILGLFSLFQWLFLLLLKKRITWFFHFLALTAVLANFSLIQYFFVAKAPLDESLFFFSWDELKLIIGVESRMTASTVLLLLTATALYFGTGWLIGRYTRKRDRAGFILHSLAIVAVFFSAFLVYDNEEKPTAAILINNKLSYFAVESTDYFWHLGEQGEAVKPADFKYLDPAFISSGNVDKGYPLMHDLPETSNLARYFEKKGTKPPNIVLIIVESMSSDLVGKYARETGNLMPFLDSLSEKSLYFPNMLSTCERTYNVLPAVLTSVPNAPNGKMLQMMPYPNHWSLPGLLKKQYYSRFYCGVDLSFCNMIGYMNHIQTDYVVSRWNKPPVLEIDGAFNPWGYPDEDIYAQAFSDQQSLKSNGKSRLDIFLTISTHDPYIYPHADHYEAFVKKQVQQRLPKGSNLSKRYLENARKLGAFSYTDDALKGFFEQAKKMPEFENTIFVITGDHGTEFCIFSEISRFKVPMIIYSPLLKEAKTFESVSTHLDIAPTLLNFLRREYLPELPGKVPFVGREVDTRSGFHADRTLSFSVQQCSNDYMFSNGYALLLGGLYKTDEKLFSRPVEDAGKEKTFRDQLKYYNLFSRYILEQDRVVREEENKQFMKETEYALWQTFVEGQSKEEKTKEAWFWFPLLSIPEKTGSLKAEIEAEVFCRTEETLKVFPNLIFSLENENKVGHNFVVSYYPLRPSYSNFKANSWNKIHYTMVVAGSDLDVLKKENTLKCFLYNSQRKPYQVRNVKTTLYRDKEPRI